MLSRPALAGVSYHDRDGPRKHATPHQTGQHQPEHTSGTAADRGEAWMSERVPPEEYPLWVKMGLWGLPGRVSVWGCFWLSIAAAVGCIAYGFWRPVFFVGAFFFLSAWMYWWTIWWVDRHGRWD
jgi:hypothetical protein